MSDLLNQIRTMSPEEKAELAAALKDLEPKPEQKVIQLGTPMGDPRNKGRYERELTPEEKYDRDHPIVGRLPFGYYERTAILGQPERVKVWTKSEIIAHNEPIEKKWIEEKRRFFPDAVLPPTPSVGASPENRFSDLRYIHPTMSTD